MNDNEMTEDTILQIERLLSNDIATWTLSPDCKRHLMDERDRLLMNLPAIVQVGNVITVAF